MCQLPLEKGCAPLLLFCTHLFVKYFTNVFLPKFLMVLFTSMYWNAFCVLMLYRFYAILYNNFIFFYINGVVF